MLQPQERTTLFPLENGVPRSVIAVDRAGGDLRRGLPVLLLDDAGPALVQSVEFLGESGLAALARLPGNPLVLAVTGSRARALGAEPGGAPVVVFLLGPDLSVPLVRALSDPETTESRMHLPRTVSSDSRTENAVHIVKSANLLPAALVKPLDQDVGEATRMAAESGLLAVSTSDIASHDRQADYNLRRVSLAQVPLEHAPDARIIAFRPLSGGTEQFAIVIGDPEPPVLTRIHSQCFTGDLLGSLRCDCGDQLRGAIAAIGEAGGGVLVYLTQEGRGIGIVNKLRAYELQDQGRDTYEANQVLGFGADERHYRVAAEILRQLGYLKVRLLTNNPEKMAALGQLGIDVVERVRHWFPPNPHSRGYLEAKTRTGGHLS